jgi:hypothetical protein
MCRCAKGDNTCDCRVRDLRHAFIRQKVSVRVLEWNPWTDLCGIIDGVLHIEIEPGHQPYG